MSDSLPSGSHDDIKPVNTAATMPRTAFQQSSDDNEKNAEHEDPEQGHVNSAADDLNTKQKQVRFVCTSCRTPSFSPTSKSHICLQHEKTYSGWLLCWLAYQSTGVIYGDIGTSPLYVYSSTFTEQPSWDDLVGALSIIIWSLTIMVTIKYVLIVLHADDDGEGGTFALYSLLARFANITGRDPKPSGLKLERHLTGDLKMGSETIQSFLETSRIAKLGLRLTAILGVSLVMADGILTPAQSVLGAIQGLRVVKPDISTSAIVGISCAILVLVFILQPFGTARVATGFAPIVIVWLLFNLCCGIYNLAIFDHTVLKAFSPHYAFAYLIRNGERGWHSLGGLLLAFTGVEALFADLGAFSSRAIQLSWLCLCYPCLLLAYIGQAAFISQDESGTAFSNPFFNTLPPGSLYFGLILAVLAAIVASQAMITSSFQLLSQVMALSYFPHIKMVHTSKIFHGQVYMPLANWFLMIGTVIVTAIYNNTTSLGNAYGVCVILTTFVTTNMVALVAIVVWKIHPIIVIFVYLFFAAHDGAYLSSALTKIPDGAWFTIILATILASVFVLWRFGKESQWKAEANDRYQPSHLIATNKDGDMKLTPEFGGGVISSISGVGIFFDKSGDMVPVVFAQFVRKFTARPDITVFFHMRSLSRPTVPENERYILSRTSIPSCYRLTIRHGYTDKIVTPDLGRLIVEQLVLYITRDRNALSDNRSHASSNHSPSIQREIDAIERAYSAQTVYVVGKEQMKIREGTNMFRRLVLEAFLWIRENSRTKIADMNIPVDSLIEVGFVKEI